MTARIRSTPLWIDTCFRASRVIPLGPIWAVDWSADANGSRNASANARNHRYSRNLLWQCLLLEIPSLCSWSLFRGLKIINSNAPLLPEMLLPHLEETKIRNEKALDVPRDCLIKLRCCLKWKNILNAFYQHLNFQDDRKCSVTRWSGKWWCGSCAEVMSAR